MANHLWVADGAKEGNEDAYQDGGICTDAVSMQKGFTLKTQSIQYYKLQCFYFLFL